MLREAVERLWAEAMRSRPEVTRGGGSDACTLVSNNRSDGGCSGGSVLVMLRGTLLPVPTFNHYNAWKKWLVSVLSPCLAAAAKSRPPVDGAARLGFAGTKQPHLPRRLEDLVAFNADHVVAPESGFLLLRCRTAASAATLAALVAAAGDAGLWPTAQESVAAVVLPAHVPGSNAPTHAFQHAVLQVCLLLITGASNLTHILFTRYCALRGGIGADHPRSGTGMH